jgi:hypothetical protein
MGETSAWRFWTLPYCQGCGVDVGAGDDPITERAIRVEWPPGYGRECHPVEGANIQEDGRSLRVFADASLDYVYSSHLLEDFPLDEWPTVLVEWMRVVRPGGYLVMLLPDRNKFRAAVAQGQPDNLAHHHEPSPGELSQYFDRLFTWDVWHDTLIRDDNYNILFVAQRKRNSESQCPVPVDQVKSELDALLARLKGCRTDRILEIGTGKGGTLWHWLDLLRAEDCTRSRRVVITLDNESPGDLVRGTSELERSLFLSWSPKGVDLYAWNADSGAPSTGDRVRLVVKDVDFLFIDGGVDFEARWQDWQLYRTLVRPGGLIAVHPIQMVDGLYGPRHAWEGFKAQATREGWHWEELIENPGNPGTGIGLIWTGSS